MGKPPVPNTSDTITPAVFRQYRTGEVIALFPYIPASADGWLCRSFMHVGQHGAADPDEVIRQTGPVGADDEAVWELISELTGDPYRYPPIRVLHRIPLSSHAYRRQQASKGVTA